MSEQRVYIRFPGDADAAELAALYRRNREFFEKFSQVNRKASTVKNSS